MRRFLWLSCVLLLALRAWAGDPMVVSAALPQAAACAMEAGMQHGDHGGPHASAAPAVPADHAACEDGHAHADCGDCQVCHSAWLTATLAVPGAPPLPHAAPVAGRAAFASADPARQIKPPIFRT